MTYEKLVENICGQGWKDSTPEDFEGGVGVAIVLAYLKGTSADVPSISLCLGVPESTIWKPFHRLLHSGIFKEDAQLSKDKELLGEGVNYTNMRMSIITDKKVITYAWCQIAALAAGIIFRGY